MPNPYADVVVYDGDTINGYTMLCDPWEEIQSLRSQLAASLKLQMDLATDLKDSRNEFDAIARKYGFVERALEDAAKIVEEKDEEIKRLREALEEIRDSKFCQYDQSGAGQYGIGVADGHRYCSAIAAKALERK